MVLLLSYDDQLRYERKGIYFWASWFNGFVRLCYITLSLFLFWVWILILITFKCFVLPLDLCVLWYRSQTTTSSDPGLIYQFNRSKKNSKRSHSARIRVWWPAAKYERSFRECDWHSFEVWTSGSCALCSWFTCDIICSRALYIFWGLIVSLVKHALDVFWLAC